MCPFLNPPPSRSHPSFPVPKANSSHPLLCENLSVSFLPIHHTTYYVLHLDLHQTSHVQLHNPSHSALVSPLADDVVKQQYPKMCVSSRGWRARPCLLQILMAKFKQEPFFPFSSQGHDSGQRSKVVGPVTREDSANKAKPLVLIGLCKQQICWVWQAWEQRSPGRSHYHNHTRREGWWVTGCVEQVTTRSFKAKMKSREKQWQQWLLLL